MSEFGLSEIRGEGSSMPLPKWQKPQFEVTIVKSEDDRTTFNPGPLIRALSKMKQAKREGRPVTNTIVIHNGEEVDLGPILSKMERLQMERRPEPESEKTEKPSLESLALEFDKAKQERREQGREDVQQDKWESFILEMQRLKLAQGKGEEHLIVPPENRQFEQGKCISGLPLDPYCNCSPRSCSGSNKLVLTSPIDDAYVDLIVPIWLQHISQLRQTHCFDIDVHPGLSCPDGISICNSKDDAGLMTELALRAIHEYNERECNVFKYMFLKIEKVNFKFTDYVEYWMTVKVLNLTIGTTIETFQIHAGKRLRKDGAKVIFCCQPKEEAVVGLASCGLCLGKLRGDARQGEKEKVLEKYF